MLDWGAPPEPPPQPAAEPEAEPKAEGPFSDELFEVAEGNVISAGAVFAASIVLDALTALPTTVVVDVPTSLRTTALVLTAIVAAPPVDATHLELEAVFPRARVIHRLHAVVKRQDASIRAVELEAVDARSHPAVEERDGARHQP